MRGGWYGVSKSHKIGSKCRGRENKLKKLQTRPLKISSNRLAVLPHQGFELISSHQQPQRGPYLLTSVGIHRGVWPVPIFPICSCRLHSISISTPSPPSFPLHFHLICTSTSLPSSEEDLRPRKAEDAGARSRKPEIELLRIRFSAQHCYSGNRQFNCRFQL